MPDDDLASLIGFETLESTDYNSKEELCTLTTKFNQLKSNITKQVTDVIQSSVPSLVADIIKANFLGILSEALKNSLPLMVQDSIKHSVSESIKEKLPLFDA
ncbi:hypothetical protein Tco_0571468 [Tanacetum coccineum]